MFISGTTKTASFEDFASSRCTGEMFTVKEVSWDSPSGPGVKTLASGAEGVGSVPGHILF